MRYVFALTLLLAGCAEEEEPTILFDCTCDTECDGTTSSWSGAECSKRSEIQAAVDDAVAACGEYMRAPPACTTTYHCGCRCVAKDPEAECTITE